MLDDLSDVLCMLGDFIIFGDSHDEHDARVKTVLKRLEQNGVTTNFGKREFPNLSISYLGHVISAQGNYFNQASVQAIMDMEQPTNMGNIRRFIDLTNQLGKVSRKLATERFAERFDRVKLKIVVIALYDPNHEITLSLDASSFVLGAVLIQRHEETMHMLQGRREIDKEAPWSLGRFSDYLFRMQFPLVSLLSSNKNLDAFPHAIDAVRIHKQSCT